MNIFQSAQPSLLERAWLVVRYPYDVFRHPLDALLSVPALSFLIIPTFSSYSTSLNLLFFYVTWSTLILSNSPLKIEILGTLGIRVLFYLLPALGFLAFDAATPNLAVSLKEHGETALPMGEEQGGPKGRWWKVALISTANVLLGVAMQSGVELLFTRILHIRSALKVTTTLPMPWAIAIDLIRGLFLREILSYVLHRYALHHPDSPLTEYHMNWQHTITAPFAFVANYDHPLAYFVRVFLPTYLPALLFRFHLLTYHMYLAVVSLEETFAYSGYNVLPSGLILGGIARRQERHLMGEGKGNYSCLGIMDFVVGTSLGENVVEDVREEAENNHTKKLENGNMEAQNLDLKPDTISLLTKKIEANLKNGRAKNTRGKAQVSSKNGGKNSIQKGTAQSNPSPKKKTSQGTYTEAAPQNPIPQGKKRSRDGQLKVSSNWKPGSDGAEKGSKKGLRGTGSSLDLEKEILALGGSKDDLKLIEDATSGSEIDGDAPSSKRPASNGLGKELLRYVKELGIDQVSQDLDEDRTSELEDEEWVVENTVDKDTASIRSAKAGTVPSQLQVEPGLEWYAAATPLIISANPKMVALPSDLVSRLHEYAKSLLNMENERYHAQTGSGNSDRQFYSTIMNAGTLSDKISALTLSIQESPLHNMKTLEMLVGLARKRSRAQAVEVLGALKDLFGLGSVLPSDRKLRKLKDQPDLLPVFSDKMKWMPNDPLPKPLTEGHLILWAFEDWLKDIYFEILKILETWCSDEIAFARGKAVDYVCQLLREKPEQEANLLRLLVNKLGDSDKKISSKTSYHILQLENAHPLMKLTIISAIENDLLFRPGQTLHAQYYAAITLNQTVLSSKEEDVVKKLLDIYFSLFAKLLAKPEAKPEADIIKINQKGDIQGGGGPAGKAARKKAASKEKATAVEDDLREKMLSAVLTGVNRAVPYTNTSDESFEMHLDTLFRITHSSNFNTSVQALMLIQQLNTTHQGSMDRYYRTLYESLLDPRLLTSSKQALYLNLLFKSLRSDLNINRVKAFAKRLLQVVSMHQPSFACGALYMLRELESTFAGLSTFVDDPEVNDSDEEEAFQDVAEPGDDGIQSTNTTAPTATSPRTDQNASSHPRYDSRKREPLHSNAAASSLWELLPFLKHYHPSVSLFAARLLTHDAMPPKPDLSSHTLIHFLDRFVYRNPKSTTAARGASIMQPISSFAGRSDGVLLAPTASLREKAKQPVNSEAFWKQAADDVGADEAFFHRYFSKVGKGREKAREKKEKRKKKEEGSEDGEEEEEEEIWKALVESRPEIEGDDDGGSDDDLDMDDLDDEMDPGESDIETDEDATAQDKSPPSPKFNDHDDDDIADFAHVDDEDDEALLGSDDEVPSDLEAIFEKETR
ncbi:MAG: hypothetical protein Q9194_006112, partial [Teloschistes cf. exilis]